MAYVMRRRPPTAVQRELAERLGVRLKATDTVGVAAARLADAVIDAIQPANGWRKPPHHDPPTGAQRDLAQELNVDVDGESSRVALELIADRIEEARLQAVDRLGIRTGAQFCRGDLFGHEIVTVSSVGPDGVVRLIGDGGTPCRWDELHRQNECVTPGWCGPLRGDAVRRRLGMVINGIQGHDVTGGEMSDSIERRQAEVNAPRARDHASGHLCEADSLKSCQERP
jgi:hypothetical protein